MVVCRQAGNLAVATFGASVRFGSRFGSVLGSRSVRFVCGSVGWRAGWFACLRCCSRLLDYLLVTVVSQYWYGA
jgi:hypothetical protein